MTRSPEISVVLVTHDLERRGLLRRAIAAVEGQTYPYRELVLVADGGDELVSVVRAMAPDGATLVHGSGDMSLSEARNAGASAATGDVYAFTDDDCEPRVEWLEVLAQGHELGAAAVGGPALPSFPGERPWCLPERWDWLVGCGPYYERPRMVRNTYGCNLSFNADVFDSLGGFDDRRGKDGSLSQGEETELCARMEEKFGHRVLYLPRAAVTHVVQEGQLSLDYLMRRAYHQGLSKAAIGVGDEESGFLADVVRGSASQAPHKTLAEVAYTEAVVAGYVRGRLGL